MKTIFTMMIILMSAFVYGKVTVSDKLVDSLIKVESNGNDSAVGDNGKAVGCLQIWKCIIDDVNKKTGSNYNYGHRLSRKASKAICKAYIGMYATEKRLGHKPTNEDMARIWNGGPNGHKKTATIGYWKKVKSHL